MRPDILHLAVLLCFSTAGLSQIPSKGKPGTLEICNWNIEWFGNTRSGFGPSDDALQQKNIHAVIRQSGIDIWVFCEVSGLDAFDSMMKKLPDYGYCLATYQPEQKTAVVYRKNMFRVAYSKLSGTNHKDSFSTGRFPFEVALLPLQSSPIDTLFIMALHLKSNIGTDKEKLAAYHSRKRSSEWLKMYLGNRHKHNYCMVLGDWNDDLNASIYNGLPSPFTDLQKQGFPFSFITQPFSDDMEGTTTGYDHPIDHQLVSSKLLDLHLADSVFIWHLEPYVTDYETTTSDHYPVYSFFSTANTSHTGTVPVKTPQLIPIPAQHHFHIPAYGKLTIYNPAGQIIQEINDYTGENIDISHLASGLYLLTLRSTLFNQGYSLIIQH